MLGLGRSSNFCLFQKLCTAVDLGEVLQTCSFLSRQHLTWCSFLFDLNSPHTRSFTVGFKRCFVQYSAQLLLHEELWYSHQTNQNAETWCDKLKRLQPVSSLCYSRNETANNNAQWGDQTGKLCSSVEEVEGRKIKKVVNHLDHISI